MKCKYLLTLVGITAMLAGCNKEETWQLDNRLATTKSFTVNVDDGVNTRAASVPTRYVMEVYKGTETTPVSHTEQATGVFENVLLDNGETYTALFWADYGVPTAAGGTPAATNEYDVADLKAAKVAKQPTMTAFAGTTGEFTVGTTAEDVYTSVTLTHAVAMVNFVQTEALTSAANTLTVKYPKSYSLNVADGAVTEIAGEVTHTFAYSDKTAGTLGTSYIIAATTSDAQPAKTLFDITATMNGETPKTISNVPFERRYRTNISGAYSNKQETALTVTCEADWGTPDNDQPFPVVYYAIGDLYPDAENPIGVVFQISNGGVNGKILSLTQEANKAWGPADVMTDATDSSDGLANMRIIQALDPDFSDYPAFAAAHALNGSSANYAAGSTGVWYLPARGEWEKVYFNWWYSDQNGNNQILTKAGGTALSTKYWSSTDGIYSNNIQAVFTDFTPNAPYVQSGDSKNTGNCVRCIMAF